MSRQQPALKLGGNWQKSDLFLSSLLPRPRPPDLTAALFLAPRRPPRTGSSPPLPELPRTSTAAWPLLCLAAASSCLLLLVWLVRPSMCMLSWREEGVVLLAGGEAVLVTTLCASSTLYSFKTYSHKCSFLNQFKLINLHLGWLSWPGSSRGWSSCEQSCFSRLWFSLAPCPDNHLKTVEKSQNKSSQYCYSFWPHVLKTHSGEKSNNCNHLVRVTLYKESPKLRKSSSSEGFTQAADFLNNIWSLFHNGWSLYHTQNLWP